MQNDSSERFPQVIKIGSRLVGQGQPVFVIAEIGANFDNNLEKAKKLALAAKEAGADVAKFQSFLAKKIVSRKGFASMKLKGVHGSWGRPVNEVFKDAEFPRAWHKKLFAHCKKIGIMFASSPYDFEAIDLLDDLGVEFFKIGSGDITWHEELEYIAKKGKPMILSTGASTLAEVDEAISVIEKTGNNKLILVQCITNYPSHIESANINVLKTYQTAYNIITGYSTNAPGYVVFLGSVALGGKVFETHFTLSRKDAGPDHPHSVEFAEFKQMIDDAHALERALGTTRKEIVKEEEEMVIVQRRSLYATKNIEKGQILKKNDIIELRPALGILPKYKPFIIGKKLKTAIEAGEAIYWKNIE